MVKNKYPYILLFTVFILACGIMPTVDPAPAEISGDPKPMTYSEPNETKQPIKLTVMAITLNMRANAGTVYEVIHVLDYGNIVTWNGEQVTPIEDAWYKVTYEKDGNKIEGWVNSTYLVVIP